MKQTRILPLVLAAVVTAVGSFSIVRIMVSAGAQVPVSQLSLILTLVSIAVVVLALAVPMIRYRRALASALLAKNQVQPKRVDPFYAYRLLLLSKATAISGTLFLGWHLGVLTFQLASPVVASQALPQSIGGCIASAFMAIAGLIVERICKLPDSERTDANQGSKQNGKEGATA